MAGYGLAFAAFLITAGRLGDDRGRRRVYMLGLALFTASSAACGLAPSPTTLILARLAQGVAGGDGHAAGARDHRRHLPRSRPRPGAEPVRRGARARRRRRPGARRRAGADGPRAGSAGAAASSSTCRSASSRWRRRRGWCRSRAGSGGRGSTWPAPRCSRSGSTRDPGAAHRGPPARLAGVDVGVFGGRPAGARRLPRAGSGASAPGRRPAARPRAVPRARLLRRPGHAVLPRGRPGGLLRLPRRCTCSPAAASGRSRRASCSPFWRSPTSSCPRPRRP